MRKLLSVLLAVIMIFSCCTLAVNALYLETATEVEYLNNAKETESYKSDKKISKSNIYEALGIEDAKISISSLDGDDFIEVVTTVKEKEDGYVQVLNANGVPLLDMFGDPLYSKTYTKKQLTVLGMPLASIYGQRVPFLWNNLTAHPGDYMQTDMYLNSETKEIISEISKSDINLLVANINMLMLRMLKSAYSGYRFYTDENAIKLINFIGKVLDADFREVTVDRVFNDLEYDRTVTITNSDGVSLDVRSADEEIFFERVSDLSGLSGCIQASWIDYGATISNYKPLLRIFGVTEGTLLESEYMSGTKVGAAILSCAYTRIMGEGPINYFLSVFKPLTKAYKTMYLTPLKLLFQSKLNTIANPMSDEEFATIPGLLNLMFNDNKDDGYQFAPMPEDRLATADSDASEFNLILLVYFNVNTLYRNNGVEVNYMLSALSEFGKKYNCVAYAEEARSVFTYLTGDIDYAFYGFSNLMTDNLEAKPSEFASNIRESINRMIKKISDWFQMWIDIFTGNREFGQ